MESACVCKTVGGDSGKKRHAHGTLQKHWENKQKSQNPGGKNDMLLQLLEILQNQWENSIFGRWAQTIQAPPPLSERWNSLGTIGKPLGNK